MQSNSLSDYSTVEQLAERHADLFSEGQLRWALRYRDENGLAEHISQFGRRLYVHVPGFTRWFQQQGAQGGKR